MARVITDDRRLDLNNLCAELRENLSGNRSRDARAEFHNNQVGQRKCGFSQEVFPSD